MQRRMRIKMRQRKSQPPLGRTGRAPLRAPSAPPSPASPNTNTNPTPPLRLHSAGSLVHSVRQSSTRCARHWPAPGRSVEFSRAPGGRAPLQATANVRDMTWRAARAGAALARRPRTAPAPSPSSSGTCVLRASEWAGDGLSSTGRATSLAAAHGAPEYGGGGAYGEHWVNPRVCVLPDSPARRAATAAELRRICRAAERWQQPPKLPEYADGVVLSSTST